MTRDKYIKQLDDVRKLTISMGNKAEELVRDSVRALESQDAELSQQIIDRDKEVDEMFLELEAKVIKVIATQAPVASDLRLLLTALKNATDVERVGDFAKDIAMVTIELKDDKYFTKLIMIPKMAEITLKMVREALQSFDEGNVALAKNVHEQDDVVDEIFSRLFRTLTTFVMENPKNISQALRLMLVARHLERIADHAVNIANRTVYLMEGEIGYI
ncbi:MAG TPA: phosphate signaling complex protein PhoU [Candidatus Methanofastidiosa archaeon]|nr:phosphate signaling complex protein PhoU [Candidatus Methanofastidiosa archaeon]